MVKQFAGNLPFCSQGDLMIWEQYDWPMDGMGYLTFRQTPLWNLLAPRRRYMYVYIYIYTYTYTCYPPNEQKITYFPPSMLVFFFANWTNHLTSPLGSQRKNMMIWIKLDSALGHSEGMILFCSKLWKFYFLSSGITWELYDLCQSIKRLHNNQTPKMMVDDRTITNIVYLSVVKYLHRYNLIYIYNCIWANFVGSGMVSILEDWYG
jgi:hypothetical protein